MFCYVSLTSMSIVTFNNPFNCYVLHSRLFIIYFKRQNYIINNDSIKYNR